MKNIGNRLITSKYKTIIIGLFFGFIAVAAMGMCVVGIREHTASEQGILILFLVALISLFLGNLVILNEQLTNTNGQNS